ILWAIFSSDCWIAVAVILALVLKLSLIICDVCSIPLRSCSSVLFNSLLYFLSIFASSAKALLINFTIQADRTFGILIGVFYRYEGWGLPCDFDLIGFKPLHQFFSI